jgi:hypothetical protein
VHGERVRRNTRRADAAVTVTAGHEVAFDLVRQAVLAGAGDHGPVGVELAQRHVRHLEPQVTAVGEECCDQAAHQGLLRDRLASGLHAGQVFG